MFHHFMNTALSVTITTGKVVAGMGIALVTVVGIIFKSALK